MCARGACPAWSSGPSTSPLEVTFGGIGVAKNREMPSLGSALSETIANPVVLQASSFGAIGMRVRPPRLRWTLGRAPRRVRSGSGRFSTKWLRLSPRVGALSRGPAAACGAWAARAQCWSVRVTSNNRSRGPVLRWKLGAAGAGRDCAPAAPVRLSRPAPQLHR